MTWRRALRLALRLVVTTLPATGLGVAYAQPVVTRAIVDGEPGGSQDNAVVALLTEDRRLACTGTLIRPHVVLTGAHCIDLVNKQPATVFAGADLSVAGEGREIVKRLVHPEFSPEGLFADVALLGIEGELEIAPWPIERDLPAAELVDLEVRAIGYGCTDRADTTQGVGLRRTRPDAITEVTGDDKLRHGDSTCRGDSGGPIVLGEAGRERVLGVTSSGGSKDGLPFSLATSLPAFGAWVDGQADSLEAELAPSRRNSANGCTTQGLARSDRSWPVWLGLFSILGLRRARLCRVRQASVAGKCAWWRRQVFDKAG